MSYLDEMRAHLDTHNRTELIALCQADGHRASRALDKKTLIGILMGEIELVDTEGPMDATRHRIEQFIEDNRPRLKVQGLMDCDGNCHAHTDAQVAFCLLQNAGQL